MSDKDITMDGDDRAAIVDANGRYLRALHAVQAGIKHEMELKLNDATLPKHLRVGINSAMVELGTLAQLLIRQGRLYRARVLRAAGRQHGTRAT